MMKSDSEIIEELKFLKSMTVRTGIIHEAQILQLELWPFMLFQSALYNKIKIDHANETVVFELQVPKKSTAKALKQNVARLQEWASNILWDNTKVSVIEIVIEKEKENVGKPKRRSANKAPKGRKSST